MVRRPHQRGRHQLRDRCEAPIAKENHREVTRNRPSQHRRASWRPRRRPGAMWSIIRWIIGSRSIRACPTRGSRFWGRRRPRGPATCSWTSSCTAPALTSPMSRPWPKPTLHGVKPVFVFAIRECTRRGGRLKAIVHTNLEIMGLS